MEHKTLINNELYKLKKGKVLINGETYEINKGKTLINGESYDIDFGGSSEEPPITPDPEEPEIQNPLFVNLTGGNEKYYIEINGVKYYGGNQILTIEKGTIIDIYAPSQASMRLTNRSNNKYKDCKPFVQGVSYSFKPQPIDNSSIDIQLDTTYSKVYVEYKGDYFITSADSFQGGNYYPHYSLNGILFFDSIMLANHYDELLCQKTVPEGMVREFSLSIEVDNDLVYYQKSEYNTLTYFHLINGNIQITSKRENQNDYIYITTQV